MVRRAGRRARVAGLARAISGGLTLTEMGLSYRVACGHGLLVRLRYWLGLGAGTSDGERGVVDRLVGLRCMFFWL